MGVMAVPASSVRSLTSVRRRCSTIADTTPSGISLAASLPAETDAKVHFVSAFGSIIAKCAQTLPATRHTSEKWGWRKRRKGSEEEGNNEDGREKKLHYSPTTSPSDRVSILVFPAHIYVLYLQKYSIPYSTFDLSSLHSCVVHLWNERVSPSENFRGREQYYRKRWLFSSRLVSSEFWSSSRLFSLWFELWVNSVLNQN